MVYGNISKLVEYAVQTGLIDECDRVYCTNRLLEALGLSEFEAKQIETDDLQLEKILNELLDYAADKGMIDGSSITERDLFDTKLMGLLTPRPSEVISKFKSLYIQNPKSATDYFYKLCMDSDYIRRYRIEKDLKWTVSSEYGDIDITINLSKPEKDPNEIARAKLAKQSGYPKCQLCRENEGYAGRLDSPARQNLRVIPITINGSSWGFQYSPYVYYNEHCIVFNFEHTPMKIERATFKKLFSFVEQFNHYFLGSNADLPIVGGSILSHDHFQGGNYTFAMSRAEIEKPIKLKGFEDIQAGIVKWPMSVIRIKAKDYNRLVDAADKILKCWREYSDPKAFIYAQTDGQPHNTITPIARKRENGDYELDLVLRNNITTAEHPLGVFHPHSELHHIKKENIGLIEVMGLAVLPARLKREMQKLAQCLLEGKDPNDDPELQKHAEWAKKIKAENSLNAQNIEKVLNEEIGKVFVKVLEHSGVFKRDSSGKAAFDRFIDFVNS